MYVLISSHCLPLDYKSGGRKVYTHSGDDETITNKNIYTLVGLEFVDRKKSIAKYTVETVLYLFQITTLTTDN